MKGKQYAAARKHGYRSGLEVKTRDYLIEHKMPFKYEEVKIEWEDLMYRSYTPDKNGIQYNDRIIPLEWLKEKGKDKHPDLIPCPYTKIKRR